MPVPAFNVTAASHEHRRFEFWGVHNSDYYEGESRPLPPAESDMHIEKSFAGAYAIYRLTAHSGISFRRSWSHIRSDKTDVMVFWFVRRGTISVSYADIKHVSGPQECAFIRSSRAFYTELNPDTAGLVEAIYVVVPSHELHSIISNGLEAGRPYPSSKGDLFVVERILSLLFEEDDQLDSAIAEQLVKTLVLGLCKSITRSSGNPPPRLTVVEKRISDISACINRHFANPDLNTRMVAEKCGISLRYLCHILKKNQLCFSTLVWERRMERAEQWLKEPAMQHHLVCEIAYLAGFKSSAHFSRMFKTRFGTAPSAYRDRHFGNQKAESAAA